MKYLTEKDRYLIEKLHQEKTPVAKIAEMIGCCRATVYNEIKRGTFIARGKLWQDEKRYGYDVGQRIRKENMSRRGRKRKLSADDPFLSDVAALILNKKYSPEAALYALPDHKLCVKSIYNYVYAHRIKGVTVNNLPYAKPRKKKKNEEETTKREFSRGRSIEERPREILERKEYGHWEMDTVYSSRDDLTCLLVLSERKSRDELIFKIKDRTAKSVIRALDQYERKIGSPAFRGKFKTITCDNGMEFADWQSIERSCRTKKNRTTVYFCHPYCSGERGTNENSNRFIRRWIPKGDDIGLYSKAEIQAIQDWMNHYPRRQFNGLSASDLVG